MKKGAHRYVAGVRKRPIVIRKGNVTVSNASHFPHPEVRIWMHSGNAGLRFLWEDASRNLLSRKREPHGRRHRDSDRCLPTEFNSIYAGNTNSSFLNRQDLSRPYPSRMLRAVQCRSALYALEGV